MHAADPGTPARLATLDDVLAATPGTVSVWCGRLGEPPAYTRRPNVRHYAASTVKLAILVALHRAYDAGDLATQRHAVLEHAVGLLEELHRRDAHDARRLDLLGLAHDPALVGVHAVDAGLAAGHHAVGDVLSLRRPPGHGSGCPELHVVGMGDHAQRALPVLGQRGERGGDFGHRDLRWLSWQAAIMTGAA